MDNAQLLKLVEQLSQLCDNVDGAAYHMDDQNWQSVKRDLCKWATQMGVALDGLRCGLTELTPQHRPVEGADVASETLPP